MKIRTEDLTGAALNYCVALTLYQRVDTTHYWVYDEWSGWDDYIIPLYDTDFNRSGPILEDNGIATRKHKKSGRWYALSIDDAGDNENMRWPRVTARGAEPFPAPKRQQRFDGPTMRIAGLRCYVASKLGEIVDVPKELVNAQTPSKGANADPT